MLNSSAAVVKLNGQRIKHTMSVIKDLIKGLASEPVNTPPNRCPYCGYEVDCAGGDGTPEPNSIDSISLCLNCQNVLLFNDDLTVRKPTDEELTALKASLHWNEVQTVIQSIKRVLHEKHLSRN